VPQAGLARDERARYAVVFLLTPNKKSGQTLAALFTRFAEKYRSGIIPREDQKLSNKKLLLRVI